MKPEFTFEHFEAQDEYIILGLGKMLGYTVTKREAETITKWLNCTFPEIESAIKRKKKAK